MLASSRSQSAAAASPQQGRAYKRLRVYDCRSQSKADTYKLLETPGLDFNDFLKILHKEFAVHSHKTFVLATTDRTVLDFDRFKELQDGSTLYLLEHEHQVLPAATLEKIKFTPHYDTLIKGGTYEYYASEGKTSLAYALAELIDNALSATAKNKGARTIEIRMMFDESVGKPAVIVLDNGRGMTSKQLNNWAVYRLSKFSRENSAFASKEEGYVRPGPVPRSLNSDISYFGVGGKQAVFYIGDSARMISKPVGSPDVHELVLSKEEFESKEKKKEDIYSGVIRNRKPGDSSHVNEDERFLRAIISEELRKESFTAVVITGILPQHITFLKQDFEAWTRQLAHIYHYYIHGVNGNDRRRASTNANDLPKIDIQITLQEKPPRCPRVLNLKEVDDDMQTLYINAAADTFEFRASTGPGGGTVEGVLRYHPFLYDRETYPQDPCSVQAPLDDDDSENAPGFNQARGKRPIFECFWNGRLIPYTSVSEFDWCSRKGGNVPVECYSRFSGVLFTDDRFLVSTNKLTFMELELKLKNKETIFTLVLNGQKSSKRGNIQREFTQWLQNCHEKYDKQVRFLDYKETITRTDVPTKKLQHPWATFSAIEWDGKTYKRGQFVKTHRTQPIMFGKVVQFLLHGDYDADTYATGGLVEVSREPKALYAMTKIIPISKIDKTATEDVIKLNIENDSAKLPDKLKVDWPDGNPWPQNASRPAGTPLGPLKIEILNKKGETLSRMASMGQGSGTKLSIKFSLVQHGNSDKEIAAFVAPYLTNHGFWFKKIDNLSELGQYTLNLNTVVNETHATTFGGSSLPKFTLKFTIKEGDAASFDIGAVSTTLRVGMPFDIPLQTKDAYGNLTLPPPRVQPLLKCCGLELSYEAVVNSGKTLTVKNVKARGKVLNYQQSKSYDIQVMLPGLKTHTRAIKINLLPGVPHCIHVTPEETTISVENGNPVVFNVEIHDEAGNITANPKQNVRCEVKGFAPVVTDCSSTGAGQIVTKPINLKITNGEPQELKAQFVMPNQKNIALVLRELKVLPSTRVCLMELYSQGDENLVLKNDEKIEWIAGGLLENLFYRLYDEAGREVPITAEIASMIKVNWTGDAILDDLTQGKLPALQVPTLAQAKTFYQVSYQDQSVSVSFSIVPRPDEPKRLKANLPQATVKLGEILSGIIDLELVDQFGNPTKTLTSTCKNRMTVEAEGLDKSAIKFAWKESSSSVVVTGVRFQSGLLGPREMCFSYCNYVERVIVKVTAGVPAQLKLISGPEQPLQVLNEHNISKPFLVQLCDEWGNPSADQRVVVELRSSPPTLKVMADVLSRPVDIEGKASFTVTCVSGPKGYYQLVFKGSFNKKPIAGPSVTLTVLPDPKKPVSLSVKYNTSARFVAGGTFPVFAVTVVSDEGSPITTFNPAAISMFIWKGVSSGENIPETATEMKCSKPMENEKNDCFYFRDKGIPEEVGEHTIQFRLRINKNKILLSEKITVNVVANQPVKLGPDSQPLNPVVSYSKDIASRTLVENMTLRIMDSYGNPAGQDLEGKVVISMKSSNEGKNQNFPLFEGRTSSFQISLVRGAAHITRLAIMENSPGDSGSTYILLFKPEVSMLPTPLAPFELPVRFYNDSESQRKMSELTRKKDELIDVIKQYEEMISDTREFLQLLTNLQLTASQKEVELKNKLSQMDVRLTHPVNVQTIQRRVNEKTAEVERIQNIPRRVCSLHDNFRGQADVLGMVGHLALVEDDAAAWVISWHIQSDMDCVITRTTVAARRIYDDTRGRQQVMALDSVYVVPGNRPLPHIRNGSKLWDPPGNPVYARELLIYPQDQQSCYIVFKNLLGDTILIDDLDSANNYRRAVVQNKTPCPTILTRQGERVSARGKFGGAQNKAPPISSLKVFGSRLPPQYYTIVEQIDLLNQYMSALQKKGETEKERNDYIDKMKSLVQKQGEIEEKRRQLKEIEAQLVSTVRPVKRGAVGAGEPSSTFSKRAKQNST